MNQTVLTLRFRVPHPSLMARLWRDRRHPLIPTTLWVYHFNLGVPYPFLEARTSVAPPTPPTYPGILARLPSEPMVFFHYGYGLFEPGIGLGRLVPPCPATHITSVHPHLLKWRYFPGMSFANRASVGWARSTLLPPPHLQFHLSLFPSLLHVFRFLNLLTLVRDLFGH